MINTGNLFILGDSYSTYKGHNPDGYAWYYPNGEYDLLNLSDVSKTWWHRLISKTNGKLIRNESYSGTTICNTGYDGADYSDRSFVARTKKLIDSGYFDDKVIDNFIIFGGTNDSWADSPVGKAKYSDFTKDDLYEVLPTLCYLFDMLKKVKNIKNIIFVQNTELKWEISWNIQIVCLKYGVRLIELENIDKENGHPTEKGMEQISDQVYAYFEKTEIDALKTDPAVFALENEYQIMAVVNCETVMWVKVGDKCYYDEVNGILCSKKNIHKMIVPKSELDKEGKYTICYRRVIKRKPYFSNTEDIEEKEYEFRPVNSKEIRTYHIADTHGIVEKAIDTVKKFESEYGEIDFLILDGDICEHSNDVKNFENPFLIASGVTGGRKPVVMARGNHDTRGIYAELLTDYMPSYNGKSYYSVKLGKLWVLVLDSAEDKPDSSIEYGNVMACRQFREKETEFLRDIIKKNEYNDKEIKHKIVICHIPFTRKFREPFNICEDIYAEWIDKLNNEIKPDFLLCGHTHKLSLDLPQSENDAYGQKFPTVVGSALDSANDFFAGAGIVFSENETVVVFNTDDKITEINKI